jgi:TolA-binding protein
MKYLEEVNRYFEGVMSAEERKSFEKKMVDEPELMNEMRRYRFMVDHLLPAVPAEFISKMEEADFDEDTQNAAQRTFNSRSAAMYTLAAIIIILFLSIYLIQKNNSSPSSISSVELPDTGITLSPTSKLFGAMNSFRAQNFSQAETQFASLVANDNNDTICYYYGLTFYKLKNYDQSREQLSHVNMQSVFYPRALFHLALIEWKKRNKQEAKTLFQKVADTDVAPYSTKAIEALKKIN